MIMNKDIERIQGYIDSVDTDIQKSLDAIKDKLNQQSETIAELKKAVIDHWKDPSFNNYYCLHCDAVIYATGEVDHKPDCIIKQIQDGTL